MGYKPSFKWNDELAIDFAKISIRTNLIGNSVENTLIEFKKFHEQKKREDRVKRVLVGKRGMNEDGSRFYYDNRGVKWNLKRMVVDNFTFYIAESEKGETIRDKFLSDMYVRVDRYVDNLIVNGTTVGNFDIQEILK